MTVFDDWQTAEKAKDSEFLNSYPHTQGDIDTFLCECNDLRREYEDKYLKELLTKGGPFLPGQVYTTAWVDAPYNRWTLRRPIFTPDLRTRECLWLTEEGGCVDVRVAVEYGAVLQANRTGGRFEFL